MDKSTFLSKAATFKREPLNLADIGTVYIRELSATEAQELRKKYAAKADNLETSAWVMVRVVVDEDGQQVFELKDVAQLSALPQSVLDAVTKKAGELATWRTGGPDAKKNDEES